MGAVELILILMLATSLLAILAQRINIAYPIVLVVAGIGLSMIPGLPQVRLDPHLVFAVFLPPILFGAAFFTVWSEFLANLRPILLLALGLVVATTAAVAFAAEAMIGLPLAAGFVLGAIVSPPDAVAATAIASRLGLPHRVVVILEGESLINDATGLVLLQVAVAAIVGGAVTFGGAAVEFVTISVGGILFGLAAGYAARQLFLVVRDPGIATILSLLVPYGCYLPAEALGVSGVLATVTAGIFVGTHAPVLFHAGTRLRAGFVWNTTLFLLNGLVFILIGLQLDTVLDEIAAYSMGKLLFDAAAISAVVVVVRILWVFPAVYVPRWLFPHIRRNEGSPPVGTIMVISWAGMRGIVSLAAALSLPETVGSGAPFPERSLLVFHAFAVIVATLLVQGLTLPSLIRWFGVKGADNTEEALEARRFAIEAALARLDELARADGMSAYTVEQLRQRYLHRLRVLDTQDEEVGSVEAHNKLVAELIGAERRILVELRRRGVIGDEIYRGLERELDLRASEIEWGAARTVRLSRSSIPGYDFPDVRHVSWQTYPARPRYSRRVVPL
jgi:monovalent cation/hydrogen antiporter